MTQFISYTRVSTTKQGIGLEAQAAIIESYVQQHGGIVIDSYTEKESGKDTINRPGLQAAIKKCKQEGATLIVAKLDRLSRDVADIFALKKDRSLQFVVCDMDASDTLMLGVMASLAQKERELISRRTREALQALKAEGKQLGSPKARETMLEINRRGVEKRHALAMDNEASRKAYAAIRYMSGTLAVKAAYLNENGFRTRNGKEFQPMQVKRLIDRYGAEG